MWEKILLILLSVFVMMSVSHTAFGAGYDVFPRASLPSRELVVARVTGKPFDLQLALVSLQGLVNRDKPRIYLLWDARDLPWLEKMYLEGLINMPDFLDEPEMLFERFSQYVKGVVVYDPDRLFTVNVATVVSACEELIIASPRMAELLGMEIVVDLRNRFEYEVDGYRWAWETYRTEISSQALAVLYPTTFDGRARDYLIANKIFTFWVSGPQEPIRPGMSSSKERTFAEEVFAAMPPNIPLFGFWYGGEGIGIGELPGTKLASEYAKYGVCTDGSPNLSFHSGFRFDDFVFENKPSGREVEYDPTKVYITFIMSDGDNMNVWDYTHFDQQWQDPNRSNIPIGWTMGPALGELKPFIAKYYYETATEMDYFLAAVSGIGYIYPGVYADRLKNSSDVFSEYLSITEHFMEKMGMTSVNVHHLYEKGKRGTEGYAKGMPGLESIFYGYCRTEGFTYKDANWISQDVPVFRAIAEMSDANASMEQRINKLVWDIRGMVGNNRPAFAHVFVVNWFMTPSALVKVMEKLGDTYVAVRPDEFVELFYESQKQ